ncbi:MAG: biotin transporter BioY [Methanoregulaceae archaeon]|jgi:biotin transport system substrate-specific component|nr:biotin transporter BioY [Methanoregulaceae archaeon]
MYKTPARPLLLAETAAFAGLIALGSWISVPFVPVPFTLQTLFVLLSGAVMRRYAILPTGLYVLMGILGIPVFHNGSAGLGILLGPTGGYILGFIPGAFITGIFFERRERAARVLGIMLGDGVIFLCGMLWLSLSTGISLFNTFLIGVLPFIPGDVVKGYAVWLIGERLERVSDTGQEGGSGA